MHGPGPAAYNYGSGFASARSTLGKFGMEKKIKDERMNSPGPGEYS